MHVVEIHSGFYLLISYSSLTCAMS